MSFSSISQYISNLDPRSVDWNKYHSIILDSLQWNNINPLQWYKSEKDTNWKIAALFATGIASAATLPPFLYVTSGAIASRRRHARLYPNAISDPSTKDSKTKVSIIQKDHDIIIIGAGVIGCALASVIAKKNPSVSIILNLFKLK